MLTVERVEKSYRTGGLFARRRKQVLSGISFEWKAGECLGIIGESGSGKSTLGRLLLGIERPDRGSVRWEGRPADERRARRGSVSAVFQDYTSSIHPFFTVEKALMEPLTLRNKRAAIDSRRIDRLLEQVGLDSSYRNKYPHELSGGEAQRVCIARAVATEPRCILLDEAVSSLDGSVQVQVLDLLRSLKTAYDMGYIFITHDIQAAAYLCDRVMIVRDGRIEETVDVDRLRDVQSPYAKKLLDMVMA
ncbi:ABC transporter ATP-binding protein [Cohnella xylanilytica]|uniref:ABC transporter ATP-binding protein n=1 Tax=Cohnella xylanilytica TaxID=557555 RepID=A0A841TVJ2_9BACL|nr:ABC transporter ATP-binding protein [Cohnella xylanilytica]MBB6690001.1 ABC transporter ATP-binding protein [Cohnella xylanilytica]